MAGSIERRGDSYRLIVSAGTGPGGIRKRYTKTIHVKSPREAEKELAKFITEVESSSYIEPSKLTFKAFCEKWLKEYADSNLAPKTRYEYERFLELRIIPGLGHLQLSKIKPIHLVEFYSNLQEEGIRLDGRGKTLSNKTIVHYHRLISVILETAVKWQLIPMNPANKVDPPKVKKTEADFFDENEILQMIEALEAEDIKYKVAVMTTISSGLRLGELMGLKWTHINFDNQTIEIKQSNQYIPGVGTITKDPKNETSKRIISMPVSVMDMINKLRIDQVEQRLKCGDKWKNRDDEKNTDFVFTQWDGRPMHPSTPSKWFVKFLENHGLRKITFHQLRHTSATMLINAGLNIRALSSRLGHSNTSTTLNIYSHALKSADKSAAEKMEEIMFSTKKKEEKNQA